MAIESPYVKIFFMPLLGYKSSRWFETLLKTSKKLLYPPD